MSAHMTTRGDHTLNVRVLRFRAMGEREEPAMLALDLVSMGRPEDAISVAEAALAAAPDDIDLVFALGRALLEAGELERAQATLTRAATLDRDWEEPYAWLARTLVRRDRERQACDVAERAFVLGCDEPDVGRLARRAAVHRALDRRLETLRADPDSEEPTMLALALIDHGRLADARGVVDAALAADPDDEDLWTLAARCAPPPAEIVASELEHMLSEIESAPRDTVVGEPAPRLHQPPRKRTGWLPKIDARRAIGAPRTSASGASPRALKIRRDATLRFFVTR